MDRPIESEDRMAEIREKAEELMLNMAALYVQARDAKDFEEDPMPALERIGAALYVQARDAKDFEEDPMPALERIGAALEEALAAMPDSPIDGEEIESLLSAAERDAKISQALGRKGG